MYEAAHPHWLWPQQGPQLCVLPPCGARAVLLLHTTKGSAADAQVAAVVQPTDGEQENRSGYLHISGCRMLSPHPKSPGQGFPLLPVLIMRVHAASGMILPQVRCIRDQQAAYQGLSNFDCIVFRQQGRGGTYRGMVSTSYFGGTAN